MLGVSKLKIVVFFFGKQCKLHFPGKLGPRDTGKWISTHRALGGVRARMGKCARQTVSVCVRSHTLNSNLICEKKPVNLCVQRENQTSQWKSHAEKGKPWNLVCSCVCVFGEKRIKAKNSRNFLSTLFCSPPEGERKNHQVGKLLKAVRVFLLLVEIDSLGGKQQEGKVCVRANISTP